MCTYMYVYVACMLNAMPRFSSEFAQALSVYVGVYVLYVCTYT